MRRSQPWRTIRARTLRANQLRANQTSAERKLWSKLRNRQLAGFKFMRQAPVASYYADFVCRECRVIVEIDGATHSTAGQRASDTAGDHALQQLGYRTFRASNIDVYENLDGVLEGLLLFIREQER